MSDLPLSISSPETRGPLFARWRTTLAWEGEDAAAAGNVSVSDLIAWEDGVGHLSEASWELLVCALRERAEHREDIALIMAGDGRTPLRVVTMDSYLAHFSTRGGRAAEVGLKSVGVDGKPALQLDEIETAANEHVVSKFRKWDAMRAESPELAGIQAMHMWMLSRILARKASRLVSNSRAPIAQG
ncbi:hypothetical protein CG017_05739 (plasmid) [Burkholderia glumae]|nr:hypothetical protein CG017_05739 [Burkholderia glumae]